MRPIIFGFAAVLMAGAVWAGSIQGKVKLEGTPPKAGNLDMKADPLCLKIHKEAGVSEEVVVGQGGALANVLVYLTSGVGKSAAPEEPAVLDQNGCLFKPHVVALRTGQKLKILNNDGILHNVHAFAKVNKEFNMAMPKFRKQAEQTFGKAEMGIAIKCDVHPWMGAWIHVFDHGNFSVSGPDGAFALDGLPAGDYQVEAWHEKFGTQSVKVSLGEGEDKTLDLKFAAE